MKKLIILLLAIVLFSCNKKDEAPQPSFDGSYQIYLYSINHYTGHINDFSFSGTELKSYDLHFDQNERVNIVSDEVVAMKVYKSGNLLHSVTAYSYTFIAR